MLVRLGLRPFLVINYALRVLLKIIICVERLRGDLVPHNARIHSPAQIEQIHASLREFGWTMPVLVIAT